MGQQSLKKEEVHLLNGSRSRKLVPFHGRACSYAWFYYSKLGWPAVTHWVWSDSHQTNSTWHKLCFYYWNQINRHRQLSQCSFFTIASHRINPKRSYHVKKIGRSIPFPYPTHTFCVGFIWPFLLSSRIKAWPDQWRQRQRTKHENQDTAKFQVPTKQRIFMYFLT